MIRILEKELYWIWFYLIFIPTIRYLLSFIFIFMGKKYNTGFKPKNLKKEGKF